MFNRGEIAKGFRISKFDVVGGFAAKFGLTPKQLGENLNEDYPKEKVEQYPVDPKTTAQDYVCGSASFGYDNVMSIVQYVYSHGGCQQTLIWDQFQGGRGAKWRSLPWYFFCDFRDSHYIPVQQPFLFDFVILCNDVKLKKQHFYKMIFER